MTEDLALRRHLYERAATAHGRRRRTFRRQLRLLAASSRPGSGGGATGVREPRRPHPPAGPVAVRRALT